jgi:hypothetical protein
MTADQSQQTREHLRGSAEPLSPEEIDIRLRELADWGVDLSLVQASLERTPTERLTRIIELLRFFEFMHEAYTARRIASPTSVAH